MVFTPPDARAVVQYPLDTTIAEPSRGPHRARGIQKQQWLYGACEAN